MPRFMSLLLALIVAVGVRAEVATAKSDKADPGHSHAADVKSEAHGEKHAETGKYDPFGWSTDTFVWSFVVFGLLVTTLWSTAWPKIAKALDDRENLIREGVQAAQKAREESAKAQAQFEVRLREAADQARQILDEARRDGQALRERMVTETREEIAAERERMQRDVRSATDQALQEIMHKAANLAVDVARKALREQLTPDVQAAIQRRAVEELRSQAGNFSSN